MIDSQVLPPASVAILAGGHSTRLGQDKAQVQLGGVPLLSHVVRRVAPLTDDLMLVLRAGQSEPQESNSSPERWRVVRDVEGQTGIVAVLANALFCARHDLVWVVGCDMPFLSSALLNHERAILDSWDAVVPRVPLGLEPLHALYRRRCAGAMLHAMAEGEHRASVLLGRLNTRYIDPAELAPFGAPERLFFNINTPADLTAAEHMLTGD